MNSPRSPLPGSRTRHQADLTSGLMCVVGRRHGTPTSACISVDHFRSNWSTTMKLKGPLVTLFAGLALAAVLFGLNVHVNHRDAPSAAGKATPPATTAAAAPSSA